VTTDQVVADVLQPLYTPLGDVEGARVLLPNPRPDPDHLLDPGQYFVLHNRQVDVGGVPDGPGGLIGLGHHLEPYLRVTTTL